MLKEKENGVGMSLTEDELVKLAVKGDRDAFASLVETYQTFIYSYVRSSVGLKDDASDLSQEVFLRAYRFIGSFRGDSKFSTWLYAIAKNVCLDYHKKSRITNFNTVSLADDENEDVDIPDTDISSIPHENLERLEGQRLIRKLIEGLDADYRAVLVLREFEGRSYEEIASILGINMGTVKSRINRAKMKIKEELEKRNFF